MKVTVFSSQAYDEKALRQHSPADINWQFLPQKLDVLTAIAAKGSDAVCVFVNDDLSEAVLTQLAAFGIYAVALRCAGFNNVDLQAAKKLGVRVMRVPAYSPQAVAEHTAGMMLCLSRKFHKAYNRTRDNNFDLNGLLGFNLYGKTVGLIGTGRIGVATARILHGFGCILLCVDPVKNDAVAALGARYVSLAELYRQSDIISLHCPLTPQSHHMINDAALQQMKDGVMLINTSRGALIDTKAVITALKTAKIGYLGLDVYEQEADLFFKDLSDKVIADEVFQRLLTFPNVLITGHQAFFTEEALAQISRITANNLLAFAQNKKSGNEL